MTKRSHFFALALLISVVGCATVTPQADQVIAAPAQRVLALQAPGEATLVVTRDAGFFGGGCDEAVFVDGVKVARLRPRERAQFGVSAGAHVLGVGSTGRGLCDAPDNARREIDAQFSPGQVRMFHTSVQQSGDLAISPMTQSAR